MLMSSSNDIEIRGATWADSRQVARVLATTFSEYKTLYTARAYAATTPSQDEIIARMAEGPIWVALAHETVIGTVSGIVMNHELYIRSMAVMQGFTGCGVGTKLLDTVQQFAIQHRCNRIILSTTQFLTSAIRLYGRFGFRKTETGPRDLYGTALVSMEKIVGPDRILNEYRH